MVHRALDASTDWRSDVEALQRIGIHRLLSSGGAETAIQGKENIKHALHLGFDVTVGSGVRPNQLVDWQRAGAHSFHASCRREVDRSTAYFDGRDYPVDADDVAAWFS